MTFNFVQASYIASSILLLLLEKPNLVPIMDKFSYQMETIALQVMWKYIYTMERQVQCVTWVKQLPMQLAASLDTPMLFHTRKKMGKCRVHENKIKHWKNIWLAPKKLKQIKNRKRVLLDSNPIIIAKLKIKKTRLMTHWTHKKFVLLNNLPYLFLYFKD